jgi:DNA-directed RNA polymerase subunit RPC12/RpoP
MPSIHQIIRCLSCGKELEVFSEDLMCGEVDCWYCGHPNELCDIRVIVEEREW